jgi:hypothetical protein
MGVPLSSLPEKLNTNVVSSDIFLISNTDSTQNNKITRDELSQSFTGFTAQGSDGFTIFESAGVIGLSVSGSNGFVGINDRTPGVSLDVVDVPGATLGLGQIRISGGTNRKIGISITDPAVYYQFSKKPNDTKLYLESSINAGASFSNLMAIDQSGNFAIHGTTGALTNKFLVSGEFVEFQNSGNALVFDPYNTEIKTSASDETLFLNFNNIGDLNLGKNAIYIDNDSVAPKVGIGHTIPAYTMHVSGAVAQVARFQTNQSNTLLSLRNSTNIGYFGLSANKTFIGPSATLSTTNAIIDVAGNFGLGTTGPQFQLDVVADGSSENTVASFQSTNIQGTTQVVVAANKNVSLDPTANRNSLVTFSRFDAAVNTPKWSIGNLYNDSALGVADNDCFVFVKNGYFGASPDVVAKLTSAGNLDIDGSYTSNNSYSKGKFVQTYQTQVTGTDIYFNPLYPNSSNNPSGNNSVDSPFTIANFNGSVERVMFMTSDLAAETAGGYRFEISAISPIYADGTPDGFVSGFSVSPPSNPVSFPTSGIIAATTVYDIYTNAVIVKTKANFVGSTNFTSGQLLQYRLCNTNGTKVAAANFNVVTTIAYTIV